MKSRTGKRTSRQKKPISMRSLSDKGSFSPEFPCSATWSVNIAGGIQFAQLPASQPDPTEGAELTVLLPNPRNAQGSDALISVLTDYNTHKLYIYKVGGPTPPE